MYVVRRYGVDLDAVVASIPEDEAAAWDVATTYAIGDQVVRGHRVFTSVVADNVGIDPLTVDQSLSTAEWLLVRYTNARAAFDGVLYNPSTAGTGDGSTYGDWAALGVDVSQSPLVLDISLDQVLDTAILFGLSCLTCRLIGLDASDAVVIDREFAVAGRFVGTWYDWFFTPMGAGVSAVSVTDIPASVGRVVISLTGDAVSLGELFLGNKLFIGDGLGVGTSGKSVTASRYEFSEFGHLSFVQRPTRTEMTYTVVCPGEYFFGVKAQLDRLAGGLAATIGSQSRSTTLQMGILGTVDWEESNPDEYQYTIAIRGLT